jgi:hypothetical protein
MRLVEVALLEEARVRLEHRGADVAADPVTDLTAQDRRDRDEHQQLPELEVGHFFALFGGRGGARGEHACHEQQGVPRQDREQHPGLDEDHHQQSDERPGAEVPEQGHRIQEFGHQRQMGGRGGHGTPRYRRGHAVPKFTCEARAGELPANGNPSSYSHS